MTTMELCVDDAVVDLICEGRCNPSRPDVDREVERFRSQEFRVAHGGNRLPLTDDRVVRALRALRHTPHRPVPKVPDRWACTVCHTPRRWGKSFDDIPATTKGAP